MRTCERIRQLFNTISPGAKLDMPLQDTLCGACVGSLTNQIGICWMFTCNKAARLYAGGSMASCRSEAHTRSLAAKPANLQRGFKT